MLSLLSCRRSFEEFRILQQFLQEQDVLVVFGTDVFPEASAFTQHHRGAGLERLRENLRILNGGFVTLEPCLQFLRRPARLCGTTASVRA